MDDNELQGLFAAFDDVTASDSLKSSTLDFIMSTAAAAPIAEAAEPAEVASSEESVVTATRGGKSRARNKWRTMRVAAVAACLALALTGGAAYAYPATTVKVTQGETTIELRVNLFGQVVGASANDDDVQSLIDQMGLRNTPYEESVMKVSDSLKESNPEVPVEVSMNGETQQVDSTNTMSGSSSDARSDESHAPDLTVEREAVKTEVPEATSQQDAVAPAPSVTPAAPATPTASVEVANPETPVVLPDPSGVTSSDNRTDDGNEGARPPERSLPQPAAPEPGEANHEGEGDGGPANSGGGEPDSNPPAAPEGGSGSPQENPAEEEPAIVEVEDDEPEDEVVYDNTRPTRHYTQSSTRED